MSKYIDAEKLYKKTAELEAEAMEEVLKHDPKESSDEHISWLYWNAILKERTAFKHDVADAPTADVRPNVHGEWINDKNESVEMIDGVPQETCWCSNCKEWLTASDEYECYGNFCPNCGADMRKGETNGFNSEK